MPAWINISRDNRSHKYEESCTELFNEIFFNP